MRQAWPVAEPEPPPIDGTLPRGAMLVGAVVFGFYGLASILHALDYVSAAWLRPNPDVPRWVFLVLGAMMLGGAWLVACRLYGLPQRLVKPAGWAFIGSAMVMMNWLVFFAKGASCGIDGLSLAGGIAETLCRGVFGIVAVAADLLIAALLFAWLWCKPPRPNDT